MDHVNSVKKEFIRLAEEGRLTFPENFYIGEYVRKPNCQGYFPVEGKWYLFRVDEHNTPQITGPFRREGIVYACALMLHQAEGLEDYRFSEEERSVFIHKHYSSREELPADQ